MDIKQLSIESGVEIKGVITKGNTITFLDLSPEDELKVRKALETHVPVKPIPTSAEIKLIKIQEILNAI